MWIYDLFQTSFSREHQWTTVSEVKKLHQAISFALVKITISNQQILHLEVDF